jgi:hypothetical protein
MVVNMLCGFVVCLDIRRGCASFQQTKAAENMAASPLKIGLFDAIWSVAKDAPLPVSGQSPSEPAHQAVALPR